MRPLGTIAALARSELRPRWRRLPLAAQLASTALVLVAAAFWSLSAFLERQEEAHDAAKAEVSRLHAAELAASAFDAAIADAQRAADELERAGDDRAFERLTGERRRLAALADTLARVHGLEVGAPALVEAPPLPGAGRADQAARARRLAGAEAARDLATARDAHERLRRRLATIAAEARRAEREHAEGGRRDAALARVALAGAVLLVLVVWMRVVTSTLRSIVRSANAVAEGDYPPVAVGADAGNEETTRLAAVFERLALAVAEREQILRSDILQLRELEQMKSAFVSTVSHELRTPLTSVRGALGLVLGGAAGETAPKARELLRIAHQNTERLIRLINDILDIEKLESGHTELRRETCDLAAVVRTTITALDAYAAEHDVSVVLDPPGDPVVLRGDADRLVQVATNLVSNAVKFSPRGSVVRVRVAAEGAVARLSVADSGPGIPAEFHSRIFGRFQQADGSGSRSHGGTGLGLAIVRSIVELHGGSVRFDTAPGVGTTFEVELPLETPVAPPADPHGAPRDRVLIVDGDPGMRSVLEALCAPLAEVVGVASPDDGWRIAGESRFDAVIADPAGADGIAFLRRLRTLARYDAVPVLVFSAAELPPAALEGIVLGPTHVFVKTRDPEGDLVMRLRAALLARRARYDAPAPSAAGAIA